MWTNTNVHNLVTVSWHLNYYYYYVVVDVKSITLLMWYLGISSVLSVLLSRYIKRINCPVYLWNRERREMFLLKFIADLNVLLSSCSDKLIYPLLLMTSKVSVFSTESFNFDTSWNNVVWFVSHACIQGVQSQENLGKIQ